MAFLDDFKEKKAEKELSSSDIAQKYSVILTFISDEEIKVNFVSNKKNESGYLIRDDLEYFSQAQKLVLRDIKELNN